MLSLVGAAVSAKAPPLITLDAAVFATIGGVVVPYITAVLAKETASRGTKSVVTLLLSIVLGTLSVLTTNAGHAVTVKELVLAIGAAWVVALSTYQGFAKPTTLAPKLHHATGRFGLGRAA